MWAFMWVSGIYILIGIIGLLFLYKLEAKTKYPFDSDDVMIIVFIWPYVSIAYLITKISSSKIKNPFYKE